MLLLCASKNILDLVSDGYFVYSIFVTISNTLIHPFIASQNYSSKSWKLDLYYCFSPTPLSQPLPLSLTEQYAHVKLWDFTFHDK